jgi:hypothetical protein
MAKTFPTTECLEAESELKAGLPDFYVQHTKMGQKYTQ